jgi:hypothetical protein
MLDTIPILTELKQYNLQVLLEASMVAARAFPKQQLQTPCKVSECPDLMQSHHICTILLHWVELCILALDHIHKSSLVGEVCSGRDQLAL